LSGKAVIFLVWTAGQFLKMPAKKMPEAVRIALAHNHLRIEDIDILIPHQANERITQMVAKSLGSSPGKGYQQHQPLW
jgi:3-oxoacyl-[acyl-carrier-protein] synthase III